MGYIQFHGVYLPEDNVVSLGVLSKHLQRQQEFTGQPGRQHNLQIGGQGKDEEANMAQLWDVLMGNDGLPAGAEVQPLRAAEVPTLRCSPEPSSLEEDMQGQFQYKDLISVHLSPCTQDEQASGDSSDAPQISETPVDVAVEAPAQSPTFARDSAVYRCSYCPSNFKVRGYLTRHLKKHMPYKDFRCPYWSEDCRCHSSGEFSRKDTFRTHLKSIHFVYPVGTTKAQRNNSVGRCAACYEQFNNNKDWLKYHIDAGRCTEFKLRQDEKTHVYGTF
ncbi:AFR531Wp [Eremothecium gossypii ATCC 10895]|uniref:AFR531Wp n=1 Tax=Eremothecium gossypii (strain ATCC 10895 / CBS 109.51 / FGSC 9923 / NRRL Y-1056) TaxID=284811 RepID=Q752P2_EREGS|nr:AFR531Wp [Eremothecium gossypii ATCC 10895]AAS53902.1 AFR531Wp [Eremothecium gossypii ATCC 10895]AEY98215.1 FAFR531Wp [Eremothecium gossypii FDAG1]